MRTMPKWNTTKFYMRPWYRWFAWYPVKVALERPNDYSQVSTWVWLMWVEQSWIMCMGYRFNYYRPLGDGE